jgi:formamidopyrimidine-DNA glycosylase
VFGLRGRLIVNGAVAGTDGSRRQVSPRRDHVRLSLEADGDVLELEDQLRLATLEIDPDEGRLGTDVLELTKGELRALVEGSRAALKSLLMDQGRIAGIGNLVADEVLFQAKIDPRRTGDGLSSAELDDLWTGLRRTRARLLERNGSHRGVMIQSGARERDGRCPRCDAGIRRVKVGGRTTYFCPDHQR